MARPANVVSHGPRLEELPYLELDLGYVLERPDALSFRVLSTVAFLEDLFHYSGKFEAKVALRNLFAEATHVLTSHLSLWVGSRMVRGDDIYLLDYWPLDNLNTLGGGIGLAFGRTRVQLHVGVNRLDDAFQLQRVLVPNPRFGTEEVTVLDRQRTVVSLKATRELPEVARALSLKLSLYGEAHALPSGTRLKDLEREELPSDVGWVAGLQLGAWGFGEHSFANLWARVAGGLAAYGELAVPFGLDPEKRAAGAREAVVALSGNYERRFLGLMLGGYVRYFRDADTAASDPDDGWEYVAVARPHLFLGRFFQQAFELSLQARRPNGLDPETQTHLMPRVFRFSVLPTLSWDRGTYTRPQIRAVYTVSYLDSSARQMFPLEDPRRGRAVCHFLGLQAEWWYNSSSR
jgi:maltoporin